MENSANMDLIGQASDEKHTLETNKQINKLETQTTFAACSAIQKEQQPFIISSGANFWTDGQQLFLAIELRISGILLFLSCKISCKQVSLKPPTCQDTFTACSAIQREQQPFIISSGANTFHRDTAVVRNTDAIDRGSRIPQVSVKQAQCSQAYFLLRNQEKLPCCSHSYACNCTM